MIKKFKLFENKDFIGKYLLLDKSFLKIPVADKKIVNYCIFNPGEIVNINQQPYEEGGLTKYSLVVKYENCTDDILKYAKHRFYVDEYNRSMTLTFSKLATGNHYILSKDEAESISDSLKFGL